MASRNYKTNEERKAPTASIWGVTEMTKAECELVDRYAAQANVSPSQFLGRFILPAFNAHVQANPLPKLELVEQPKAAEHTVETVQAQLTRITGKSSKKRKTA